MENKENQGKTNDAYLERLLQRKLDNDKKSAWKAKLADDYGVQRTASTEKKKPRQTRLYIRLSAAAAVLLLLVFALPMLNPANPTQIVDSYLIDNKYPHPADRKNASTGTDARILAGEYYLLGDYSKSIEQLNEIVEKEGVKAEDHFFLGLSHMYNSDFNAATQALDQALEMSVQEGDTYTEDINWFLALSHYKAGNLELALSLLQNIQPNEWNYNLAQEIISQID